MYEKAGVRGNYYGRILPAFFTQIHSGSYQLFAPGLRP